MDKNENHNPNIGDYAVDKTGMQYVFRGEWIPIPKFKEDISERERIEKMKAMYDSGVRHYMNSGIRMTLRPDGTEYIDKPDMPA